MALRGSFLHLPVAAGALMVVCALLESCSSGSKPVGAAGTPEAGATAQALLDPTCTAGGLTIAFNPMYSAFDGTHTFQVPAVVVGSDQAVTWFADSSMVGMQADDDQPNEVLITMLASGITTIHVQSTDGKCGSAPLTIDAALESDWEIGSMRYNDGVSVHLAGPPKQGTGSPLEVSGGGGPACTNCHGETATKSQFTDVSHTPEQTGGFSDQDMLNIILNGTFPPGAAFDWSIVPYPVWMDFHRWTDIQPDQQKGIIVYLRSLTPAPQRGAPNYAVFATDGGMTTVVTTPPAPDGGSPDAPPDVAAEAPEDAGGTPEASMADVASADASADAANNDAGEDDAGGDGAPE